MSKYFTIKVTEFFTNTCVTCQREFDMTNSIESNKWSCGHDCDPISGILLTN